MGVPTVVDVISISLKCILGVELSRAHRSKSGLELLDRFTLRLLESEGGGRILKIDEIQFKEREFHLLYCIS